MLALDNVLVRGEKKKVEGSFSTRVEKATRMGSVSFEAAVVRVETGCCHPQHYHDKYMDLSQSRGYMNIRKIYWGFGDGVL